MSNTSILALHGFTGCGEDFEGFSPLCHTLPTWHCPTLPGHGPEPQLDCSPDATIRFVEATLLSLHPSQPQQSDKSVASTKIILGYSMGARAALNYACSYPDSCDALILIGSNAGIENENDRADRRAEDETLAQQIEIGGIADFLNFWEETPLIRKQRDMEPYWRSRMMANRLNHQAIGLASSLRQFGQGSCPNLWPQLSHLKFPVLLVTGSEDAKYTAIAERMLAALPNATHRIIAGASHAPHFEAPEATAMAVDKFIEDSVR